MAGAIEDGAADWPLKAGRINVAAWLVQQAWWPYPLSIVRRGWSVHARFADTRSVLGLCIAPGLPRLA